MNTIFVQIASYRDKELVPTVLDCIKNAKHPDNLRFSIGWQHADDEDISDILKLKNVKILDIPYKQSKGACWVRAKIQSTYNNEKYTLQLDSHHRFIKHWDEILINMYEDLKKVGVEKPLLTSYLPSYQPTTDPVGRVNECWQLNYDRFLPEGVIFKRPSVIKDWSDKHGIPVLARGLSGHFIFTKGVWCTEVPYDPELYFHGEEITLAVRSFTHGYDLYHPTTIVIWHHYTRQGSIKHWDDHPNEWDKLNKISYARVKALLNVDSSGGSIKFGKYGLGKKRSLRHFEKYAGVDFSTRRFTDDTIKEVLPVFTPIPTDEIFEKSLCNWVKYCLDVYKGDLPLDDYDFFCVVFKNEKGEDLYRKDCDGEEIKRLINQDSNDKFIHIWREFNTNILPYKWTVWPHSKSKGWETKVIENTIPYA